MAYTAGNLVNLVSAAPGRSIYRYDSTDDVDAVEAAGYFNNLDDDLNLQKGDLIIVIEWSGTVHGTGTIIGSTQLVVTNVISNTAAASPGNVNTAQAFIASGLVSSLL